MNTEEKVDQILKLALGLDIDDLIKLKKLIDSYVPKPSKDKPDFEKMYNELGIKFDNEVQRWAERDHNQRIEIQALEAANKELLEGLRRWVFSNSKKINPEARRQKQNDPMNCPKCNTKMINKPLGRTYHYGFWSLKIWSNFQETCYKCGHTEPITKQFHNLLTKQI